MTTENLDHLASPGPIFKTMNGWTKAMMKEAVLNGNKGAKSVTLRTGINGSQLTTCAYRGVDGNKCAAGCFIPDEYYRRDFEGRIISDVMIANSCIRDLMPLEVDAMDKLQAIHDGCGSSDPRDRLILWIDHHVID